MLFAVGAEIGVSHGAHVGGLVLGVLVGCIFRKIDNLPKDIIFLEESAEARKATNEKFSESQRWQSVDALIEHNPQSWSTMWTLLKQINKSKLKISSAKAVSSASDLVTCLSKERQGESSVDLKKKLFLLTPEFLINQKLLLTFKLDELTLVADALANQKQYSKAKKIYLHCFHKSKILSNRKEISESLNRIDNLINNTHHPFRRENA